MRATTPGTWPLRANVLSTLTLQKTQWPNFGRRNFQIHLLAWKLLHFINISLEFVPKSKPSLVQIMAWSNRRQIITESMLASVLTHMCVIQPRWCTIPFIKNIHLGYFLFIEFTSGTLEGSEGGASENPMGRSRNFTWGLNRPLKLRTCNGGTRQNFLRVLEIAYDGAHDPWKMSI